MICFAFSESAELGEKLATEKERKKFTNVSLMKLGAAFPKGNVAGEMFGFSRLKVA